MDLNKLNSTVFAHISIKQFCPSLSSFLLFFKIGKNKFKITKATESIEKIWKGEKEGIPQFTKLIRYYLPVNLSITIKRIYALMSTLMYCKKYP
jgi:hypothetical protein